VFGPQIGPLEIALVLVIALIVLGPKRLPEAGRSIGRGMRVFKDSISGKSSSDDDDDAALPRTEQS
jgi:sec-independent protein translocase protein TatA